MSGRLSFWILHVYLVFSGVDYLNQKEEGTKTVVHTKVNDVTKFKYHPQVTSYSKKLEIPFSLPDFVQFFTDFIQFF